MQPPGAIFRGTERHGHADARETHEEHRSFVRVGDDDSPNYTNVADAQIRSAGLYGSLWSAR